MNESFLVLACFFNPLMILFFFLHQNKKIHQSNDPQHISTLQIHKLFLIHLHKQINSSLKYTMLSSRTLSFAKFRRVQHLVYVANGVPSNHLVQHFYNFSSLDMHRRSKYIFLSRLKQMLSLLLHKVPINLKCILVKAYNNF